MLNRATLAYQLLSLALCDNTVTLLHPIQPHFHHPGHRHCRFLRPRQIVQLLLLFDIQYPRSQTKNNRFNPEIATEKEKAGI